MPEAVCACGALRLVISRPARLSAACHCLACQKRTGSPFSANLFYRPDDVTVVGPSAEFVRIADSGNVVRMRFCPGCGSTTHWVSNGSPELVGVASGALADPDLPPPQLSVFERSKHRWVEIDNGARHFQGMPDPDAVS